MKLLKDINTLRQLVIMGMNRCFMKHIILRSLGIFIFLALGFSSQGQSRFPGMYLVSFTDKDQSPYSLNNPNKFLSERAILRRSNANILVTEQDLPVNPFYIDSLSQKGAMPSFSSRWLNAVLIQMDDSLKMLDVLSLPFVDSIAYLAPVKPAIKRRATKAHTKRVETGMKQELSEIDYGSSFRQLEIIGLLQLHKMGYYGEGVHIAVLDNGFRGMPSMEVFDNLFDNAQVLGTKAIANPKGSVYSSGNHGTYVMTTMASFQEDVLVGSAPGASYWLIETEDNSYEYPIEEFNWAVGAEYADSVGADIITSSLIYSTFEDPKLNHTLDQLNGETAIISRVAQIATEKGILVFNSAGNDAVKPWQKIAFPADAKNIITVGAVDKDGVYANFSSVGYSADNRVKPDVAGMGKGVSSVSIPVGNAILISGTSYSTPTVAGAAAILLQANPTLSKNEIRMAIKKSASQYQFPDSLLGYGIPNFYLANILLKNEKISEINNQEGFTLMPNPFVRDLAILFNIIDSQSVDFQIVDISGKVVWESLQIACSPGINLLELDNVAGLAQGNYVVVMRVGDRVYSEKLIK